MTTKSTTITKDKKEKQDQPAPPKLTYSWLKNIETSLRRDILKVPDTGFNYIINKNLVKLDRFIKEHEELFEKIRERYLVKNAKGDTIYYAYHSEAKNPQDPLYAQLKNDANGNYIEVSEKDRAKTPATARYDVLNNPQYKKDVEAWENDVEFTFHKFPQTEIEQLIKDGKLDTIDYTPLIGFLFDEFE